MGRPSLVAEAFAEDYAKLIQMTEDLSLIREYLDHIRLCFISLTCLAYVMMVLHFIYQYCISSKRSSERNPSANEQHWYRAASKQPPLDYDVENPGDRVDSGDWGFAMPQLNLSQDTSWTSGFPPPPPPQVRSRHGSRDEETALMGSNGLPLSVEQQDDYAISFRAPPPPASAHQRRQAFVKRLSTVEESDQNDENHSSLSGGGPADGNVMVDSLDTSLSYYTGTSGAESPQKSPTQSYHQSHLAST